MLKVTYTETGLHLEHLPQSLEEWIASRVILTLRTSQRMMIEQSTASILLLSDLVERSALETVMQLERSGAISLAVCDAEYVELSLYGAWVGTTLDSSEGVFVAALSPKIEQLVVQLWQQSQINAFPLWR